MEPGEAGLLVGCLLARTSLTVLESESFGFAGWSRRSTPPLPQLARRSSAAWVLPWNMRLAKRRAKRFSFSTF